MFALTLISLSAAWSQAQRYGDRRALWSNIKRVLVSNDGYQYFDESVRHTMLPELKGTVVAAAPLKNSDTIVLALSDKTNPEVTLKLFEPSSNKPQDWRRASIPGVERGDEIEFMGVADDFVREPFMVTFNVDMAHLRYSPHRSKK
jgi:hypothetical protein